MSNVFNGEDGRLRGEVLALVVQVVTAGVNTSH